MTEPIRVLVVDDHALFASFLELRLRGEEGIEPLPSVANAEQAYERCRQGCPDVVLMDIDLPDVGGVEATAGVRAMCPQTRVVVMSGLRDPELLAGAFHAGACGFVPKTRSLDDLIQVIRDAAAGELVLPDEDVEAILRALGEAAAPQLEMDRRFSELDAEELACLRAFAEGPSTGDVAARLDLDPEAARARSDAVLAKLGLRSRLEAVIVAREYGVIGLKARD